MGMCLQAHAFPPPFSSADSLLHFHVAITTVCCDVQIRQTKVSNPQSLVCKPTSNHALEVSTIVSTSLGHLSKCGKEETKESALNAIGFRIRT